MIPTTKHIIETIKSEKDYLKKRYFIKHLHLYGSYAKETQHADSDIDILYATDPNGNMTLARLQSFENYLSGLLKIDKIELVSENSINPLVAKNIEDYAISIF